MFMLVQLITAHQVVLLSNTRKDYLFYRGQVYSRPPEAGYENLPENQQTNYSPVWALVSTDSVERAPTISRKSNIWPIQASSPNPIRWRAWTKQLGAALLGMPLWTMEELTTGYALSLFSLSVIDSDQSPVSSLTDLRLLQVTPSARLRQVSRISRGIPPAP